MSSDKTCTPTWPGQDEITLSETLKESSAYCLMCKLLCVFGVYVAAALVLNLYISGTTFLGLKITPLPLLGVSLYHITVSMCQMSALTELIFSG